MSRLVFLLEEPSIKVLLDLLLPRLYPELNFLCIPHEGKNDLEKSIPHKLKAFRDGGVRFIIVRDKDRADCIVVKKNLQALCRKGGRDDSIVRIVCQELEAWYLGDPQALATAFEDESLSRLTDKARFRRPDEVVGPAKILKTRIPGFQKISAARRMAAHMDRARNKSRSFHCFLEAVDRVISERVA